MVLLDVVYNHFGPEGNYLHAYAPQFFNRAPPDAVGRGDQLRRRAQRARCATSSSTTRSTGSRSIHFDGLRLDAVHAIADDSQPAHPRRARATRARRARAASATSTSCSRTTATRRAAWRATATARRAAPTRSGTTTCTTRCTCCSPARRDGYYADYARRPAAAARARAGRGLRLPGRAVAVSRRRAARRAERAPAAGRLRRLPAEPRPGRQPRASASASPRSPTRGALRRGATRCLLLAPHVPMLFMGEEFARRDAVPVLLRLRPRARRARSPTAGARSSRASRASREPASQARIPDPNDPATFERSQARLGRARRGAGIAQWLALYRALLALRRQQHRAAPARHARRGGAIARRGRRCCACDWPLGDGARSASAGQPRRGRIAPIALPAGRHRATRALPATQAHERRLLARGAVVRRARCEPRGVTPRCARAAVPAATASPPTTDDIWGKRRAASDATRCALLARARRRRRRRRGDRERRAARERRERWRARRCRRSRWSAPSDAPSRRAPARSPAARDADAVAGACVEEDGARARRRVRAARAATARARRDRRRSAASKCACRLRACALPAGYHRLRRSTAPVLRRRRSLVVAPARCYRAAGARRRRPRLGAALQLYALRSERNWGIGDFTDLRTVVEQWGARGAGVVGVNPLHALFPHNPAHASPYSPSSRLS